MLFLEDRVLDGFTGRIVLVLLILYQRLMKFCYFDIPHVFLFPGVVLLLADAVHFEELVAEGTFYGYSLNWILLE